jgi:methylenetetrahydrofolate reductase (NADPH)
MTTSPAPAATISFEVFPPKDPAGLARLDDTIARLGRLDPAFVSVTYGAGGSSRDRSFQAIETAAKHGTPIAGHLTCVGQSRADLDGVIDHYRTLGVDHIVALRGDPPGGIDAPYEAHPDGYTATEQLVSTAKARGFTDVSVSAYPERHPQSPSGDHDLDLLAAKVDAGATRAITQMCFDDDAILRYIERVGAAGIDVEVAPGIFPIHSFPAVARFAGRCGATIPARIAERFAGLDDDPETTAKLGAEIAAEQIARLRSEGVRHTHLYTLNRADLVQAVCERL